MKFKNWVTGVLLCIAAACIMSVLIVDNTVLNIIALGVAAFNISVLTKYSKICE